MGNTVRIVLETTEGDICNKQYLLKLQELNDQIYLLPNVDPAWMRSLWTPSLRWTEVTEEGCRGGPMMPERWDGDRNSSRQLQINIGRAGLVGSVVADNLKSSMIIEPLLDKNVKTGELLVYRAFLGNCSKCPTLSQVVPIGCISSVLPSWWGI